MNAAGNDILIPFKMNFKNKKATETFCGLLEVAQLMIFNANFPDHSAQQATPHAEMRMERLGRYGLFEKFSWLRIIGGNLRSVKRHVWS